MKKNLFLKFLFREIRKNSVRKPNWFSGASSTNFFCFTLSLHCWYSIPSLVWFGQLLDPLKKIKILKNSQFAKFAKFRTKTQFFSEASSTNFFALHCHYTGDTQYRVWFDLDNTLTRWKRFFFEFSKFRNSRNSQNSVWKTIFFLGKLYQQLLALHCHYIGDTQYRVWFDLDTSLTRWKKPIFKIPFSRNSKSSVWKPNFFLGKLNKKYFLLYTPITLVILHTPFVLIWKTPWPDAKEIFLKFSKIRNSRNSQNSVWKTIFFLGKLYQQLFALHCHYMGDTQNLVWFDLDNSLRWRRTFLKFFFREIRKIPYEKPIFFRGKLYQFYFALHCHYTGDTQYRVWFDLGNSLTRWKTSIFKILKNSHFAKFAKFRTKNHFFLGALYQNFFCFTLSLHWWYSIPRLVWFGQLLNPTKKKPIFKIPFSRNSQNFRTKTQFFFRGQLYHFFLLYTLITLLILNTEFGLIWTTP